MRHAHADVKNCGNSFKHYVTIIQLWAGGFELRIADMLLDMLHGGWLIGASCCAGLLCSIKAFHSPIAHAQLVEGHGTVIALP